MEASIRHLHAMGAGLPTCNPSGGGNGFVNLLVGRAKLGFVSELVESFKFRKLGFIDYNGDLRVHSSLLNILLHD